MATSMQHFRLHRFLTLTSIEEFFSGIERRMGKDRFIGRQDSLHLTAPGWQALGVIHHDVAFKQKRAQTGAKYQA
jgi:hypothetical protein